jgi:heptosyltransferase-2
MFFGLPDESGRKRPGVFRNPANLWGPLIGLNTGAGTKFRKQWPAARYLELISLLREKRAHVFLLGGPKEKELNRFLARRSRARVYDTGSDNSLLQFAGWISRLDLVVSSDTLGMHLAIALKKPVVALFGPTCPQEIDLYGRGAKIFQGTECSPCYKPSCPDAICMSRITPEQVFAEIDKFL